MLGKYVYHSSSKTGLKVLKPHLSTHNESWVYATKYPVLSALFIGEHDDFDLFKGVQDGYPLVGERYEGALTSVYKGISGSLYTLDSKCFFEGKTSWSAEVVSESEVAVLHEEKINDMYKFIIEQNEKGNLHLFRYPTLPTGLPKDKSDLVLKAVRFTVDLGEEVLERVEKLHPELLPQIIEKLKDDAYRFRSEKYL